VVLIVCCATEAPCSSGNCVGDAGAVLLAQALEKNTTLHTLDLESEFVVLCLCYVEVDLIVVYVVVGCCWVVFWGEGACAWC